MPAAIPVPIRQQVIERHDAGVSVSQIAQGLGLSFWTVRRLVRRVRDGGAPALVPRYDRCGPRGPHAAPRTVRAVRWLRRRHPTWGTEVIRTVLVHKWPHRPVPSARTLQRWLRTAGLARPRRRQPRVWHGRGATPHAVWQMDAVEQEPLGDGSRACWLTVSDEASGAIVGTEVFPPGRLAYGAAHRSPGRAATGVRPLGAARCPAGR